MLLQAESDCIKTMSKPGDTKQQSRAKPSTVKKVNIDISDQK